MKFGNADALPFDGDDFGELALTMKSGNAAKGEIAVIGADTQQTSRRPS